MIDANERRSDMPWYVTALILWPLVAVVLGLVLGFAFGRLREKP